MPSLSSLYDAARRRVTRSPAAPDTDGRRQFFHRAGTIGAAATASLLVPDDAWAGVEERAARFGITPGTVVDAQGRPAAPLQEGLFMAEIMMFGGNFAPRGWAFCDGQLLAINAYQALFSLLGTTYGGDGRTTFALPDMRSRHPIHPGDGPGLSTYTLGEKGGRETVTLTTATLPSHNHSHNHTQPVTDAVGTTRNPNGNVPATDSADDLTYAPAPGANQSFQAGSTASVNTGAGLDFQMLDPFLAVNFIIATQGIYPSRS